MESIAVHQPALVGEDPLRGRTRFLDAYEDRFFKEMAYVSDSCRAWRDAAWRMLATGPLPQRLQLVLHPVNWGPEDRDRIAIFAGVHAELRARLDEAQRDLAEKVARHSGVLEHEARLRRGGHDGTP